MSLRPRYSLLTLFLLTALVAGGVKLWRGPHHVVELDGTNWEKEYRYTRNWDGKRIIHGPMVKRQFVNQKIVFFTVLYYQQGEYVDWAYVSKASEFAKRQQPKVACPLSAEELREFQQIRDTELQRFHAAGGSSKQQLEGIGHYVIVGGGARMRSEYPNARPGD